MAPNYSAIWNTLLNKPGTQNVDIIASISEDGLNHYLEKHHSIDNRIYHREVKKVFNTQTDSREFKVNLDINSPIQIQFPPYKDPVIANEFRDRRKWYELPAEQKGPELTALQGEVSNIQVYCEQINIKLTWPKLHPQPGQDPNWTFSLRSLKVFAEAHAVLNNNQDGYYVTITPTKLRFDVTGASLLLQDLKDKVRISKLPKSEIKLIDECQEKFTDLFVLALNIIATEQTPKLVKNIRIPAPVIKDRPVLPALLNISENCLTIGVGLDKAKAEKLVTDELNKELAALNTKMSEDIQAAGGLLAMVSKNKATPKNFEDLELKSEKEIYKLFTRTTQHIEALRIRVNTMQRPPKVKSKVKSKAVVNNAYAVGIDEYFFDTIVNAVMPAPKHECSGWLDLAAARGRACYWVKIFNPDITIDPATITLNGGVNVDVGGALEACIRKFWDCSWKWECGSLSIAVKGRPNITIRLLNSSGIRLLAQLHGQLHLDVNLPFPFNAIISAVSTIIFAFVMAAINVILLLLTFVVIYPELTIPEQITKIKLRNFDSFYYPRPQIPGSTLSNSKNKFIAYKGGLVADR